MTGLTVAYRGCVQGLTVDCMVYRECLQGLRGGGQKDGRENTRGDRENWIFIRTGVFRANSEGSILLRYNFLEIFRLLIQNTL